MRNFKNLIKGLFATILWLDVNLQASILIYRYLRYASSINVFREYNIWIHGHRNAINRNNKEFQLRRNIHRIEKGLMHPNRRRVFGTAFIYETVQYYVSLINNESTNSTVTWARRTLSEYFAVVDHNHKEIGKSLLLFQEIQNTLVSNSAWDCPKELTSLYNIFAQKKSVRYFSNCRVSDFKVQNALRIATLAPSGCNRQAYRFVILSNYQDVQNVLALSSGTNGWRSTVQSCAVLVSDLSAFGHIDSRHAGHVDAILAATPFTLALKEQGVESCFINWSNNMTNERKMRALIGLKKSEKVVVTIAFGYDDGSFRVARSERKNPNEIS